MSFLACGNWHGQYFFFPPTIMYLHFSLVGLHPETNRAPIPVCPPWRC